MNIYKESLEDLFHFFTDLTKFHHFIIIIGRSHYVSLHRDISSEWHFEHYTICLNLRNVTRNSTAKLIVSFILVKYPYHGAFQEALVVRNPSAKAGDIRCLSLIPGWGRSPGGGHGNPL